MRPLHLPSRCPSVAALLALFLQLAVAPPATAAQFPLATTSGTELTFSVATDGTNYLTAILGDAASSANITAQLVSPSGSLLGARIQTGRTGSVPDGLPLVAYGGNTYLMVWQDNAGGVDLPYGQLISRSGTLQGAAFPVSSHAIALLNVGPLGVAFGGSQFLVVWNDDRNGNYDIYGRFVSPAGSLGPEIAIATGAAKQVEPAVAFDGTNRLVVWEHRTSTGPEQWDVYGALVSPAGTVGSAFKINQTSSPSYNPLTVAFDGANYMVVWNRDVGAGYPSSPVWDLYARLVTPTGVVSGNEFAVTTTAGGQVLPRLAFGQGYYLALWSDKLFDGTGNCTVSGTFFNTNGMSLDSEFAPFTAVGSNRPLTVGVIFDGTRFVVMGALGVFNSGTMQFTSADAYGTFIQATNAVDRLPAVTSGSAANVSSTSATITGTVNPRGLTTIAQFEYGLTTNYGTVISVVLSPSNGSTAQTVSATLHGLQPGMTYHFRLVALNGGGTGTGSDATYLTPPETAVEAWVRRYTGPGPNYAGSALAVDSSNSVIVLGEFTIIKYSNAGLPLWTNFNDITPVNTESSKSLKVDSSNCVIVAGSAASAGYLDYKVIKYSSAGVPLWTNRYDGVLHRDDTLFAMAVDGSNNVIVTGGTMVGLYDSDYCTIKYSNAGVPLWTNRYSATATSYDKAIALDVNSSNDVSVTGFADPDSTGVRTDIVTVKYSSAGVPLWTNLYNGSANLLDVPVTVAVDGSNNVIVAGSSQMTTGSSGYSVGVLIKYSSAGVPNWTQFTADPAAIAVDSGNNVIVVGYSDSGGGRRFRTLKYSSAGVWLWENSSRGGWQITEWASAVAVDGNDNIIVTGSSGSDYYDFLTIKYSSAGKTIWTMSYGGDGTNDFANAVAVDENNSVIVTGNSSGIAATVKYATDGSLPVTFTYLTNNGTITVTGCNASGGGVTIPATIHGLPVTSIGDYAFQVNFLTSVSIPNSVTNIGSSAFYNCSSLTSVSIPSSVISIGSSAFYNCSSLTSVSIPSSVTSIGSSAFGGCTLLPSVTIPSSVTSIGSSAFYYCTNLTSVTIPSSVTSIGYQAFSYCASLPSVTIPSSVTNIGGYAFESCTSLARLTIPSNVTSIGDFTFYRCTSLTNINIPGSVTSIGSYAFESCTSLASLTIPSGVTSIGGGAFAYCTSLTSVNIPSSVISIGSSAFQNCTSLASFTIPSGVTSIGGGAFAYCTSLTSVNIPSSVISIGSSAFQNCTSLKGVYFNGNAPTADSSVYYGANNATVYYLPGIPGWGATFGGRPTALWKPQAQTSDASFGVQTNRFGFNINWGSGRVVVVEACTTLANPIWSPVGTNTLTNGWSYFSDPKWTNFPTRLYRLRQQANSTIPAGMVLIPAGPFTMGNTFPGEGYSDELPLHTNQVSAFYLDRTEVTKELWDEVRVWANTHGYDLGTIGDGKATNHPVHSVNWYDVVKWCNARSEKAGLVPAYYTSAAQTTVYRTGQVDVQNTWVEWSSGYRLPTEAEWEKAARGGANGQRFPWTGSNNITHSLANYCSSTSYAFDTSPTRGYHPSFQPGEMPYTSPVGYFTPNGYGLYDMAGNLYEWCWDWHGGYTASLATDPRGPTSDSYRVFRGGGWGGYAHACRSAFRGYDYPAIRNFRLGFRVVLVPGQP